MHSRREFILASLGSLGAMAGLSSCSTDSSADRYEDAADRTWRHGKPAAGDNAALMPELVRYATLAPSSHNTQCWKFRLEDGAISILPDFSRRCPAVDPDDHHLFVSLGCAAENLIQAALAFGLKGHAGFDVVGGDAVRVVLEPTSPVASTLFQAIIERQSTRVEYDRQPLDRQELDLLAKAGTGHGVEVILLTDRQAMETVLDYVIQPRNRSWTRPMLRFSGWQARSDDAAGPPPARRSDQPAGCRTARSAGPERSEGWAAGPHKARRLEKRASGCVACSPSG